MQFLTLSCVNEQIFYEQVPALYVLEMKDAHAQNASFELLTTSLQLCIHPTRKLQGSPLTQSSS